VEHVYLLCRIGGVRVASTVDVSETSSSTVPMADRRAAGGGDRRKHSRSGRRSTDPHVDWRRLAWLFGAYAIFVSLRSIPSTVWNFFKHQTTAAG